jgi:hypothetical protein
MRYSLDVFAVKPMEMLLMNCDHRSIPGSNFGSSVRRHDRFAGKIARSWAWARTRGSRETLLSNFESQSMID